MKIVLIDPKGFSDGLNTGLGYLSAMLSSHDVSVIDFNNKSGNEDKRLEIVKDADIVGISIKSFTLASSIKLAEKIKKINKSVILIAGGPHITIDGRDFFKENKLFDICAVGEGEETIIEVALRKKINKINGLVFRDRKNIKCNKRRPWIENLDALPFPKYDNFDSVMSKNGAIEDYPLVTSRGCPYNCTYCSVGDVIGKRWRARSPKNIVSELVNAKETYQSTKFRVLDDDFTLDMKRAKQFCQMLIDNKIDMSWSCPNGVRADRLDEELLRLMKDSGCYSISLGIESLAPDVFEKINKGEKLDDIKNAVLLAKKTGIKVSGFFIIGLPGSTYKKDRQTMKEAKKLRLDYASWGILVPYPGTKMWNWVKTDKNVRMLMDWKRGFHIGFNPKPVFETMDYTASERVKAYRIANMMFMNKRNLINLPKLFIKHLTKK